MDRIVSEHANHTRDAPGQTRDGDGRTNDTLRATLEAHRLEMELDTVVIGGFDTVHLRRRRAVATGDDVRAAVEEQRRLPTPASPAPAPNAT